MLMMLILALPALAQSDKPLVLLGRVKESVFKNDLLHRLSNIHYAINATGRTVTYTNTLPRYVLLTAQYRLNINPKKR